MIRVGFGYDAHRLVPGRPLFLGGVHLPYEKGLQGHSDADVLLHAICDALLGAAALGDLGHHFPDTDPGLEGVSSITLLRRVADMVEEAGFRVQNLDATVVAQSPKLAPHIRSMVINIADAIGVSRHQVNVKASTTEGMGFTGSKQGIAAYATTILAGDRKTQ